MLNWAVKISSMQLVPAATGLKANGSQLVCAPSRFCLYSREFHGSGFVSFFPHTSQQSYQIRRVYYEIYKGWTKMILCDLKLCFEF